MTFSNREHARNARRNINCNINDNTTRRGAMEIGVNPARGGRDCSDRGGRDCSAQGGRDSPARGGIVPPRTGLSSPLIVIPQRLNGGSGTGEFQVRLNSGNPRASSPRPLGGWSRPVVNPWDGVPSTEKIIPHYRKGRSRTAPAMMDTSPPEAGNFPHWPEHSSLLGRV